MALPAAFIDEMKQVLPAPELDDFLRQLTEGEQPVSIRLNAAKSGFSLADGVAVPWCATGRYLTTRPQFTLDPMLHAGAYYVQEASSQFVAHVVQHILEIESADAIRTCLDLCAAPGGKSTAALSVLPADCALVSNEIDRKRAHILTENIQKWGAPNVCVTCNAPADFRPLRGEFDLIVADVPCSGEGMFRKDAGAIAEWNPAKVRECAALQQQILTDIWPCLRDGGYMIYSTCTFNIHEDEENLQFIHDELGGEILPIPVSADWHIHPALTGCFAPDVRPESACRFMPHYTLGEGLFMALIRKSTSAANSSKSTPSDKKRDKQRQNAASDKKKAAALADMADWVNVAGRVVQDAAGVASFIPDALADIHQKLLHAGLFLRSAGVELGTQKGKDLQPAHALALSTALHRGAFPEAELDLETALNYLRREAIVLPADTPRGYILLTFNGLPLGFVKNIGNRCNSLYPTEWRIRNL